MDYPRSAASLRAGIAKRTQPGPDGCLIWTGGRDSDGYPKVSVASPTRDGGQKHRQVHRVNWELTNGPIPAGFILARSGCDNRRCIAPAHLVLLEGKSRAAVIASMSARGLTIEEGKFGCGHPKTPENSVTRNGKGWLLCKTCRHARAKARYAAQQLTPEMTADLRARQRAYYHRNRDRINATARARRALDRAEAQKPLETGIAA